MKSKISLRIIAVLVLLFDIGHTSAYFTQKQSTDPTNKEVIRQMYQYKFNRQGSMRSWGDFYTALSFDLSIVLVAIIIMIYMLSGMEKKHPKICYKLLWPILLCFVGVTANAFCYIFVVPAVTGLVICILILWAMVKLYKQLPDSLNGLTVLKI
jgi:hypothetical protein